MNPASNPGLPLCVDMDGTLLRTDSLFESVAWTLRHAPWRLALAPAWTLKGLAHLKSRLAASCAMDPGLLPRHERFVEFLREEKAAGRRLVLATGADFSVASRVADSVGLFSEVIASDGVQNLTGRAKAAKLESRFGRNGFDYAANDASDLWVWAGCRRAIAVGASEPVLRKLRRQSSVEAEFPRLRRSLASGLLRSMRPHQWLKNLLLLVPLITSHQLLDRGILLRGLVAFASLCAAASATYLINDLCDLEHDRRHPDKARRPLAAGELPIPLVLITAPLLLAGSIALGTTLGMDFLAMLVGYVSATLLYSLWWKQVILVDVFVLAGLYTLRLLMGGAATGIPISNWLLAFSTFAFLSLALGKRYSELLAAGATAPQGLPGRGYRGSDREHVGQSGVAVGYLAILVFALYLQSPEVRLLYKSPNLLWLCCPVLLFWMSRFWLLTSRGEVDSDPVLFALRDVPSYILGAVLGGVMWLAARG
ncbi:MAG TPA: UbiA family prenyltransferase [Verrucomicrobiales bacterium]|nr:UbiA family prenyltransferase [Verrucomicrobiales bacterium]